MGRFGPYLDIDPSQGLIFDGAPVMEIAEQFGTPLFILSESTIRHFYRRIRDAFEARYSAPVIVCAGMKGNWGLAARRIIADEGGGGDAFGLGELSVAMMAGSDPAKIVMNGANKSEDVIVAAIDAGVLNQVDSYEELEAVSRLAMELRKTARVSLRIRLPLDAIHGVRYVDSRYPDGIEPSFWERTFKYGHEPEAIYRSVARALELPSVSLEGIMYHGGIPRRAGFYREETAELVHYLGEIKARTGWQPVYLNIGGGFVTERYGADAPPAVEAYAEAIAGTIVESCKALSLTVPTLIIEPGRYCWEAAGIWITRVGGSKEDQTVAHKKWIYVDGNTNEMMDPFDPRCGVHHVVIANDPDRGGSEIVDVCGQTCNAADILAKARELPPMRAGDLLAFLDMGAYNEGFACQSNAIPRSATVIVSGGRLGLARRRETVANVLSRELIPTWLAARQPHPKAA